MAGRKPGASKTGGRVKGTPNKRTQSLFDMCEEMDFVPFKAMLKIAKDETHKDSAMMLKEVAKYLYPARKSLEHSGNIDPSMLEAAENLQQLSKEERATILKEELKAIEDVK